MFLLNIFIWGHLTLNGGLVEINQTDYFARFYFYDAQRKLQRELWFSNFYGYKTALNGRYLYLITDQGIEIYESDGTKKTTIKDRGMISIAPEDKFLACVSDKYLRLYKITPPFSPNDNLQVLKIADFYLPSEAVRKLIFDDHAQFLGVMARNYFTLISLNNYAVIQNQNSSEPLIFLKVLDHKVILVQENRRLLKGKVLIYSVSGELLKEVPFYYERQDEQIQDIKLIGDSIILAQTHLKEWKLSSNQSSIKGFDNQSYNRNHGQIRIDTIPWPLEPTNILHPLGNNWGEFQNYGGSSYYHPGIDIISPTTPGVAVYAVKSGYVKAWLSTGNYLYWRIAISDSSLSYTDSCDGYLYAHIDSARYHVNLGDTVAAGELIGYLVYWPVDSVHFHHLHFAKIRDRGANWPVADWAFVFNPLLSLLPNQDTISPVFENALLNYQFAFCRDNTQTYLMPNNLNGNVDIIARVYDKFSVSTGNEVWDRLIPVKLEYEIRGPQGGIPRTLSFIFDKRIPPNNTINVVYKEDATCRSRGDYEARVYYFIVTNTDGDSVIELTDASFSWATTNFPNGDYWVLVYATDASNNTTVCSMLVTVNNPQAITEDSQLSSSSSCTLPVVYDVLGKKINLQGLKSLKPGVYFNLSTKKKEKLVILGRSSRLNRSLSL